MGDWKKRVVEYWYRSICDAEKLAIKETALKNACSISIAELTKGQLSKNSLNLFQKHFQAIEDTEKRLLSLLISPLFAQKDSPDTFKKKEKIYPFWISANLDSMGNLYPSQDITPWISRDVLEPLYVSNQRLILGEVSEVDSLYALNLPYPKDKWHAYFEWFNSLVEQLTGKPIFEMTYESYMIVPKVQIVVSNEGSQKNGASAIKYCYENILDNFDSLSLIKNVISENSREEGIQLSSEEHSVATYKHIGQSSKHALSPSQRSALHHCLTINKGESLSITGPPGTGKTSLLRDIIANQIVESALKKEDPPIIVVASTNNQAIINLIPPFEKKEQKSLLDESWLLGQKDYGLFLKADYLQYVIFTERLLSGIKCI